VVKDSSRITDGEMHKIVESWGQKVSQQKEKNNNNNKTTSPQVVLSKKKKKSQSYLGKRKLQKLRNKRVPLIVANVFETNIHFKIIFYFNERL